MAEAAFLQPRSSLDYAPDSVESAMRPFHVWMQSAVFSNIRGTVLFEDDPLSEWQKYPCVVVAGATMLDDELLERMKQYAENGGKLLIFGKFGVYDNDCTERLHPEKIFNFTADLKELHPVKSAFWNWQGDTLELPAVDESYSLCNPAGDCRIVMQSSDGEILGVSAMNGNLLWLAGGIKARRPSAMHYGLVISKWGSNPDMELPAPDYAAGYLKAVPGRVLRSFIGSEPQISCNSEKYLAACYRDTTDSKYYLHIVNTDKILARPPETVGHNYCFENFLKDAPANPEALEIKFRLPESLTKINSVMAYSTEFDGGKAVDFAIKGRIMQITVSGGTFAGYLHLLIF
jgi:hypothetical protein